MTIVFETNTQQFENSQIRFSSLYSHERARHYFKKIFYYIAGFRACRSSRSVLANSVADIKWIKLVRSHLKWRPLRSVLSLSFSCLPSVLVQSGQFSEDMIPTVGFNMRKVTKGNVTIKVSHTHRVGLFSTGNFLTSVVCWTIIPNLPGLIVSACTGQAEFLKHYLMWSVYLFEMCPLLYSHRKLPRTNISWAS